METILFSELRAGPLKLKNRINIPPMCMYQAKDGMAQEYHLRHYAALAASGAGAVTIEATAVSPEGRISPYCLGIWDDERAKGIARIVKAMKKAAPDTKVFLQIAHAGRKASIDPKTDCGIGPEAGGWEPVAPSALKWSKNHALPHDLTVPELKQIEVKFIEAAARCAEAGCDGLMLHAAHGYLIHEFLSPLSNQRTDDYGGSFENRGRFLTEIMAGIRAVTTPDFVLGLRLSAVDWRKGGLGIEDAVKLVQFAGDFGWTFADISSGGLLPAPINPAPGYQLPFAAQVKKETGLCVFGVGMITNAFQAETALQLGACDVVDIGRAALSDPNWGWHAARELGVKLEAPDFAKDFALEH